MIVSILAQFNARILIFLSRVYCSYFKSSNDNVCYRCYHLKLKKGSNFHT